MRYGSNLARAAALVACAPFAAFAAEEPAQGRSTVFTGVEVDDQDSRRVDLGLSLLSRRGTGFDLAGSRSDTDSDALALSSTYVFGQVTHDFGRFGLGAGVRQSREKALSKSLGYLGSAFLDLASARLTASVESRDTDFEDSPFTATGADLGLPGVTNASGIASCSVGSLGYGLGLSIVRPRFSVYASGTTYDYSSYDCRTQVFTTTTGVTTTAAGPGRAPARVTTPAVATRLAAPVTQTFSGYSSSRVPREGALLDSSVMVGGSVAVGARWTLGVELYQDREEFAASDTSTALAFLAVRVTRSVGVDLTLGTTDSDLIEDSPVFAGLRLTVDLGR